MTDDPPDRLVGEVVDERWKLLDKLGAGGMGVVYRAERVKLGKQVAIKFLDEHAVSSKPAVARFDREARAISRLHHRHCVSILDFGVWKRLPYIVMEYVNGRPLNKEMGKPTMTSERAVSIMRQILEALRHAHAMGVVHRDLKPENVMLTEATGENDFVKLLDFGLARIISVDEPTISMPKMVAGTPSYMSPEQARGEKVDHRTDIYSAGVILYGMVTGKKPFTAADTIDVLRMHMNVRPQPPRKAAPDKKISAELERVILRALEKERDARFYHAEEFLTALDAVPEARAAAATGRRWRNRALATAALVLVAAGGGAGWRWHARRAAAQSEAAAAANAPAANAGSTAAAAPATATPATAAPATTSPATATPVATGALPANGAPATGEPTANAPGPTQPASATGEPAPGTTTAKADPPASTSATAPAAHAGSVAEPPAADTARAAATTAAGHEPPVAAHESPVAGHEPPVAAAGHEPLVAAHESPVAAHESPVAAHESPVAAHESPVAAHEPPAAGHEPPVAAKPAAPPITSAAKPATQPTASAAKSATPPATKPAAPAAAADADPAVAKVAALLDAEHLPDAERILRAQAILEPNAGWVHLQLGEVYFRRLWRRDAEREWDEALRLDRSLRTDRRLGQRLCQALGPTWNGAGQRLILRYLGTDAVTPLTACIREATDVGRVQTAARLIERVGGKLDRALVTARTAELTRRR
jgi:eukaryotic-like serine/threonine-protein kinase